ncbi:MAG: hypothetical protein ACWGMZ_01120 [Thermoguttaceae bacterium]
MHTVELLEHALNLATRLGYHIRQEFLGGSGGGGCVLRGKKILFLDPALDPSDQFDLVLDTLKRDSDALAQSMPDELRDLLTVRKSA